MVCIYCAGPTYVVNSRHQRRSNNIWRRRKCHACGSIVTTEESIDLSTALVVQSASRQLEPFSRDKLFITVYESCRHRPTALRDAIALAQTIINNLITPETTPGLITTTHIVATTVSILDRFDPIAATLYKAAHHPANAKTR